MQRRDDETLHLVIGGRNIPKIWEGKRKTHQINRRVTQSIFRAFDYATSIGTPLTHYAVLNLKEDQQKCATEIFCDVRHRFRDWLNYKTKRQYGQATSPAYIYALENPKDQHPHANWAVYIPSELEAEFKRKLPLWLEKAQGQCGPYDCRVQPINQDFSKKLAKYIVKATDPAYIEHFHLQGEASDQGVIFGKRAGVSPSLGPAARRDAGFRPQRRRYWRQAA